jgi:hypothetical protein
MEKTLIKSVSYDQHEILENINRLYTGPFDLDCCYGSGCFYKGARCSIRRPVLCFDICPRKEGVIPADVCHLPLKDNSVGSVIFDPPFMARTGPGSTLKARFGELVGTMKDLMNFYFIAMFEIWRILKPGGYLVFKCQDGVLSGKNNNNYHHICNMAETLGYEWVDLFILVAKHRMMHPKHKVQRHARKYHCYFIVFKRR